MMRFGFRFCLFGWFCICFCFCVCFNKSLKIEKNDSLGLKVWFLKDLVRDPSAKKSGISNRIPVTNRNSRLLYCSGFVVRSLKFRV